MEKRRRRSSVLTSNDSAADEDITADSPRGLHSGCLTNDATSAPPAAMTSPAATTSARCARFTQFFYLSRYGVGIALILCVTVIWVASSEWIQYIFGSLDFNKPYFLTYFNTAGFSLWNVGYLLLPSWRRVAWDDRTEEQPIFVEDVRLRAAAPAEAPERVSLIHTHIHSDAAHPSRSTTLCRCSGGMPFQEVLPLSSCSLECSQHHTRTSLAAQEPPGAARQARLLEQIRVYDACRDDSLPTSYTNSSVEVSTIGPDPTSGGDDGDDNIATGAGGAVVVPLDAQGRRVRRLRCARVRPYTMRQIWCCAAVFCPLWFLANYLFNLSLSITSVASNTILSSTSSLWTLLLSYVLLRHPAGPLKWLAVVLCVSGTTMVGLSDSQAGGSAGSVLGDIVAVLSAFFYALYTSILKHYLPEDERFAMGMVFGAVGVLNAAFLWPGLVWLNAIGFEPFAWPTAAQLWPLALNALIGTNLSDVLCARGVVLTSPVVATLGLSLTTPLAMVVDVVAHGKVFSAVYVSGALLVLAGFVLANVPLGCVLQVLSRLWHRRSNSS